MNTQKGLAPIAIILIIAGVLIVGGGIWYLKWGLGTPFAPIGSNTTQPPGACTQEAKLCPDGSAVGRTGPNCEFAVCPGSIDTSDWQTYRNDLQEFEIKLPQDWNKKISINNQNPKEFDGYFSLDTGQEYLRIKINLFGETIPFFPYGENYPQNESKGKFLDKEITEVVFSTKDGWISTVLSRFCLNKQLDLALPELNIGIDEANIYCLKPGDDLYDFNLYCEGQSEKYCKDLFNQILSTFKFVK